MSFQAYLDTIERKTGKTARQLLQKAAKKGFDKTTKAADVIAWLATDYDLGRGHAMAIVHVLKNGATISDKHLNSGATHSDPSTTLNLDGNAATKK